MALDPLAADLFSALLSKRICPPSISVVAVLLQLGRHVLLQGFGAPPPQLHPPLPVLRRCKMGDALYPCFNFGLTSYVAGHIIFVKTISIHVLTNDEMAIFALISIATTFIAFPEHIAMPVADMPKLLRRQQTPALPPPPCSQVTKLTTSWMHFPSNNGHLEWLILGIKRVAPMC
ncbi:hypothetical protein U9M48_026539 [Paspalum notatum var. saurae]|uniref:Uncharacterized protein n=1 Tax=Paspalum notatum var. saurae TaxID=547442 RepID=A0AAQ3TUR4_PASNO